MVDITGVDIRAMIEQVRGDFDGRGEVKRRLSVSAARVNQRGIGCDQLLELVEQAQPRRRMNGNRRSALDRAGSHRGLSLVQYSKSARPPLAASINVGSRVEKRVQHRLAANP